VLFRGQKYVVCIGRLPDGGYGHATCSEFGQDVLMCGDMERPAVVGAAEALGITTRVTRCELLIAPKTDSNSRYGTG
jgi:hypothetical protein